MAVKIKLARFGKIREPFYRVVVADARTRRSGRAIEAIGKYHPKAEPSVIDIDSDRVQYWLGVGAQPTESVLSLLKVTGDWQKFKGLPGAEGTLRFAEPKPDKKSLYEAALAAVGGDDSASATTPRKKAAAPRRSEDAPPAPAAVVAETLVAPAAEAPTTEAPTTEAPTTQTPATEAPAGEAPVTEAAAEAPSAETTADAAPFGAGSHGPIADDAQPDGFPIKGNASSKLYHEPGSAFYDRTVAEVWFATTEAAGAAGFSLPKSQQEDAKAAE